MLFTKRSDSPGLMKRSKEPEFARNERSDSSGLNKRSEESEFTLTKRSIEEIRLPKPQQEVRGVENALTKRPDSPCPIIRSEELAKDQARRYRRKNGREERKKEGKNGRKG